VQPGSRERSKASPCQSQQTVKSVSTTCLRLGRLFSMPRKTYYSRCVIFFFTRLCTIRAVNVVNYFCLSRLQEMCFLLSLDQLKIALNRCSEWQNNSSNHLSTSVGSARQLQKVFVTNEEIVYVCSIQFGLIDPTTAIHNNCIYSNQC